MSLAMLSTVFTGNNQSGSARLLGLGRSNRYHALDRDDMQTMGIYRNLSSATVYSSAVCDATLLLFANPYSSLISLPAYTGRFLQITNRRNSGNELDVASFPSGINNRSDSILLVAANRENEIRVSFRDLFLERWNTMLDEQLDGSQARRDGDPVLTWEMFPNGISFLDPTRRYLKIHQNLNIELSWWPDYDASITYHIYLYLDGAGRLRGHVARWAYWVEGGIKSGEIADRLEPSVIEGMNTLDEQLDAQTDGIPFEFSDLYYLPGRQTSRAATGVLEGVTWGDVTIVLCL